MIPFCISTVKLEGIKTNQNITTYKLDILCKILKFNLKDIAKYKYHLYFGHFKV